MTYDRAEPKSFRRRVAVGSALVALALSLPAASVLAGAKPTENVSITNNAFTRVAYGSLGSARASGNQVDYIGCHSRQVFGGGAVTGGCEAKQATLLGPRSISCEFPAEAPPNVQPVGFLWSLSALTPDAHIRFTWDTVNGKNICRTLVVKNFSHNRPKTL